MKQALRVLLLLALVCGPAHAQPLAEMVRDLNAMQDRMAVGESGAREKTAQQFDRIEQLIAGGDPDLLAEERHARAAVIYLLSGGGVGQLRATVEAGRVDAGLRPLLDASLSYAEGAMDAARALSDFDARNYPATLGGHLALVQAGAFIGVDNAKAIALLDLARLLMPGALVEEAALRREIPLLDPVRDSDKLGLLAVRYAEKYAHSPFARQFWGYLPNMERVASRAPLFASRFAVVLDKAPQADRADILLAMSRRALLAGDFREAEKTIELASRTASEGLLKRRLTTYRLALAALEGKQRPPSREGLRTEGLPFEDAALVNIVESVGARLEVKEIALAGKSTASSDDDKDETTENARRALAQTDALLQRATRR